MSDLNRKVVEFLRAARDETGVESEVDDLGSEVLRLCKGRSAGELDEVLGARLVAKANWEDLLEEDPSAAQSFLALDHFCRSLIAMLSRVHEELGVEAVSGFLHQDGAPAGPGIWRSHCDGGAYR